VTMHSREDVKKLMRSFVILSMERRLYALKRPTCDYPLTAPAVKPAVI
jgi:hypothetical protein